MAEPKRKLGRGLGALISSTGGAPPAAAPAVEDGAAIVQLDPHGLKPNPYQPRMHFDEDALEELAESIKQAGVHQPIIVRRANGGYEIVSGERRVRASILADRATVPAVVRDVPDEDMLKLGLIENVQREDLNPIELARAYQDLAKRFEWTQEEIARQVGKKRVTVTNTMRLLNLSEEIQGHLINADLTMGHARALLALDGETAQNEACRQVIAQGLSVRATESLAAAKGVRKRKPSSGARRQDDPHLAAVEDDLRRRLGTQVRVSANKEYRGKIEVDFFNLDELERILDILRS